MTPPRDTLREAETGWAALRADLVAAAAYNLSPKMVTATLTRHRPIIEAALRASAEAAPGPLDENKLARAIDLAGYHLAANEAGVGHAFPRSGLERIAAEYARLAAAPKGDK